MWKKIIKKQKIKVNVQLVRNLVFSLLKQQKFILACDTWFSVCLGLRSSELLEVKLESDIGEFYDVIKVVERKNDHEALRVVPSSLKILSRYHNISYPLSQERLNLVRSFCIEQIGRYYSLRSACLSFIFTSLFQSNQFMKFHENSVTSLRYYVDVQSKKVIDKAF